MVSGSAEFSVVAPETILADPFFLLPFQFELLLLLASDLSAASGFFLNSLSLGHAAGLCPFLEHRSQFLLQPCTSFLFVALEGAESAVLAFVTFVALDGVGCSCGSFFCCLRGCFIVLDLANEFFDVEVCLLLCMLACIGLRILNSSGFGLF